VFCERLFAHDSIVFVSDFLRVEMAQAVKAIANTPGALPDPLRQRWRLHRWHDRLEVRKAWYQFCFDQYSQFLDQFSHVEEIAVTREIIDLGWVLMADLHLDSYDAVHTASALTVNSTTIATMDRDYDVLLSVPSIDVVVVGL
jgi:predicted nucleic acid-binding protein